MRFNDRDAIMNATSPEQSRMTEALIALLRHRIAAQYYDQPQVLEVIARAILHSRELYP